MKNKVALQLYTVRDYCTEDLFGTLRKAKEIGYSAVEFAGFYDHKPADIKIVLEELQLQVAGLHVSYQVLLHETASIVDAANILGTKNVVLAVIPNELRDEAGYRQVKGELQSLSEQLKAEGIRLSYHNHAFEFETLVDSKYALSYLLDAEDSPNLYAEVDVFWVKKAGTEILSYIHNYKDRMPIMHLKDMSHNQEHYDVPIGTGSIDFIPILQWGEQYGVEWYVIEQDNCRFDAMESVKLSYDNLMSIINSLEDKEANHE